LRLLAINDCIVARGDSLNRFIRAPYLATKSRCRSIGFPARRTSAAAWLNSRIGGTGMAGRHVVGPPEAGWQMVGVIGRETRPDVPRRRDDHFGRAFGFGRPGPILGPPVGTLVGGGCVVIGA